MPRPLVLLAPFALLGFALLGCDFGNPTCTAEAVPGLVIEVRDADAGELTADDVLGIARDGSFVDTLEVFALAPDMLELYGAVERSGRYDITISKPGYQTWQRDNVRVTADECHVRTVELEVRLESD